MFNIISMKIMKTRFLLFRKDSERRKQVHRKGFRQVDRRIHQLTTRGFITFSINTDSNIEMYGGPEVQIQIHSM